MKTTVLIAFGHIWADMGLLWKKSAQKRRLSHIFALNGQKWAALAFEESSYQQAAESILLFDAALVPENLKI